MSYKVRYRGSFRDSVKNDLIEILIYQNRELVTTPDELLLDSNPLVISYPQKEFYEPLFGGGAKINIINDSSEYFRYDDIFSTPERQNYIEIIKTSDNLDSSIMLFQGYVLPQMYSSTVVMKSKVTLPIVDHLSMSDRDTPYIIVDDPSHRADEFINAFDIIGNVLIDTDITDKITVHNNLETFAYTKDSSSSVFNSVFLQADNFLSQGKLDDGKIILKKVLTPFFSRIFYHDGKWHIERVPDLDVSTKTYVQFDRSQPDANVVSSYSLQNDPIDLTNHELISGTPTMTYDPGFKKLLLKLNYKKPYSLTESYFYDVQYYTPSYDVSTSYPLPKQRRWMMSTTDASLEAGHGAVKNFEHALYWKTKKSPWWGSLASVKAWSEDQFASSKFIFTPRDKAVLPITVNYDTIFDKGDYNTKAYYSSFSLRANDRDGKDWWIAKATPNDTSTYLSLTPYRFEVSVGYDDILQDDFVLNVSQTIPLMSEMIVDVSIHEYRYKPYGPNQWLFYPFIPAYGNHWVTEMIETPSYQKVSNLYLDIYTSKTGTTISTTPSPVDTMWVSNVEVKMEEETPFDILEASLGYYFDTKELSIDTFDVSTVLFTNGVYHMDPSGTLAAIWNWRDASTENLSLQEKYVQDLSQVLSVPRYSFSADVRSNDSSIFHLGQLYTHDYLVYPDTSTKILFMCNGLEYNVKENTYRLDLMEYVNDNGYRIWSTYPYFEIDPTFMEFPHNYRRGNHENLYVDTNLPDWTITIDDGGIAYNDVTPVTMRWDLDASLVSEDGQYIMKQRGSAPHYVTGIDGSALYVDNDDYFGVYNEDDDILGFFNGALSWTVNAWVKPKVNGDGVLWVLSEAAGDAAAPPANSTGVWVGYGEDSVPYFWYATDLGTIDTQYIEGGIIWPDQWQMVTASVSIITGTAYMKLYVNGVKVNEYSYSSSGLDIQLDHKLGLGYKSWRATTYQGMEGAIEDFRIYDYALTDASIRDMYYHKLGTTWVSSEKLSGSLASVSVDVNRTGVEREASIYYTPTGYEELEKVLTVKQLNDSTLYIFFEEDGRINLDDFEGRTVDVSISLFASAYADSPYGYIRGTTATTNLYIDSSTSVFDNVSASYTAPPTGEDTEEKTLNVVGLTDSSYFAVGLELGYWQQDQEADLHPYTKAVITDASSGAATIVISSDKNSIQSYYDNTGTQIFIRG